MKIPVNEREFEALMEEIDALLRKEQVPFALRSLRGLSEISRACGMELPLWAEDREPVEGCYSGVELVIRVTRWFDDRYGTRAAWDPRPGRTVVIIRDDPWEINLPRIWGSFRLFASATENSDQYDSVVRPGDVIPRTNVLNCVTDLAPGLKRKLSERELSHLLEVFRVALDDIYLIESIANYPLVPQALTDYDTAVHQILSRPRNYGLSKWSSLQAAEKMLKAFIRSCSQKPKWIHDLGKLAAEASELGMGSIPTQLIDAVQTPAGVRYGEIKVSLNEAVEAHYAAMDIGAHVASFLSEKAPVAVKLR